MSAETLAAAPATASNRATYAQRVAFVSEMAGRLHSYGTTAQRLEAAVVALAQQLDLDCEPWTPSESNLRFSSVKFIFEVVSGTLLMHTNIFIRFTDFKLNQHKG